MASRCRCRTRLAGHSAGTWLSDGPARSAVVRWRRPSGTTRNANGRRPWSAGGSRSRCSSGMWPLKSICHSRLGASFSKRCPGFGGAFSAWLDPAVPAQDLMHRGRHRHLQSFPLQTTRDLARAPGRMFVAHRQHARFGRGFAASGRDMRPSRPIRQFSIACLPACQPLVANVGTDREPPAQFPPVRSFLHSQPDKLPSLIHHRHLAPGHGRPPK